MAPPSPAPTIPAPPPGFDPHGPCYIEPGSVATDPAGADAPPYRTLATLHAPVVYYALRLADGAVKIGWTGGSPATRLRHLTRAFGPIEILAAEPGTPETERRRHAQFAALRMPDQGYGGGTEFFHAGPALARHIEVLRAAAVTA